MGDYNGIYEGSVLAQQSKTSRTTPWRNDDADVGAGQAFSIKKRLDHWTTDTPAAAVG